MDVCRPCRGSPFYSVLYFAPIGAGERWFSYDKLSLYLYLLSLFEREDSIIESAAYYHTINSGRVRFPKSLNIA
jgi:hypothetical protein